MSWILAAVVSGMDEVRLIAAHGALGGGDRCPANQVQVFHCVNVRAFKFTVPRRSQGAFGDADLHGSQQHAPLMDVQIPVTEC